MQRQKMHDYLIAEENRKKGYLHESSVLYFSWDKNIYADDSSKQTNDCIISSSSLAAIEP